MLNAESKGIKKKNKKQKTKNPKGKTLSSKRGVSEKQSNALIARC